MADEHSTLYKMKRFDLACKSVAVCGCVRLSLCLRSIHPSMFFPNGPRPYVCSCRTSAGLTGYVQVLPWSSESQCFVA